MLKDEPGRPQPAWTLLKDPPFRTLLPSIELCFLGLFVHVTVASWVMADLTGSATMVASVQTVATLPAVFLSVLAGGLADVVDRRRILIASQCGMFLASLVLIAMSATKSLEPTSLLVLAFLVASGNAVMLPAWMAALGGIAPRNQLPEAVSLHTMGANVMKTIGPLVGGVLLAATGPTAAFAFGSLSYLPALVALTLWRPPPDEEPRAGSVRAAIREGASYLFRQRRLHPIVQQAFLFGFCANGLIALLPLVAKVQYGGEAHVYGMLFGGVGFGAITAGLFLSRMRSALGTDRLVTGAIAANALALLVLSLSSEPFVGLAACMVAGGCWLLVLTLLNATLQLATPRTLVGRMVSGYMTFVHLGFASGAWVWGLAADAVGTGLALAFIAIAMGLVAAITKLRPLPDVPDARLQ